MSILFWLFGVIGVLSFYEGLYIPVVASVAVIAFAAFYLIRSFRQRRVGPLTILLFLVFALPFIHIIPYIWFNFDTESPFVLWGLAVNPYMLDKTIIESMSMIGAVGAAGFAAGVSLVRGGVSVGLPGDVNARYKPHAKTLSVPVFLVWVVIAVALTWVSAPEDTIFTAVYTESLALNAGWNFSSAWMFSYSFLVFAVADSIFETSPRTRALKRRVVLYAILLVVIWFQLLRGDRESLPFVFAALLMYYVWGKDGGSAVSSKATLNRPIIFVLAFVMLVVGYFVGVLRDRLTAIGSVDDFLNVLSVLNAIGAIRFDNLITGTWSAVLLGPLSIAGDSINGALSIKYGQTYLDLFGSIIPGFLADWIGYIRPIDGLRGPAWEMTYGIGGTHAVVVPFMDFRITGVFIIVALWGFVFANIERYSMRHLTVSNLALLGIIAMAAPHWLWYGEKNIMNALIYWFILSLLYRVRIGYVGVSFLSGSTRRGGLPV